MQAIEAYAYVFGREPSRYIIDQMLDYLQQGAEPELLTEVLLYTARAPLPSWAYASAVIARNMAKGILSAAAFLAAIEAYRAAAAEKHQRAAFSGPKRVVEQMYQQRSYDPATVDGPSAEDIREAKTL